MQNQRVYGLIHLFLALSLSIIAIYFHLIPALIAGLTTYTVIQGVENIFLTKLNIGKRSKLLATILISALIVVGLTYLSMAIVSWIQTIISDPNAIVESIQSILEKTMNDLPPSVHEYIPSNIQEIQNSLLAFTKEHMAVFQNIGKGTAHTLITILLGMIIGVFVAYSKNKDDGKEHAPEKPFTIQFFETVHGLIFPL